MNNKWSNTLVPPLVTFGPAFIAFFSHADNTLAIRLAGYAGAVGLGIGLGLIFRIVRRQQRQIDELKKKVA